MSTRICKHCGWVTPTSQTGWKCKVCGTPYDVVTCSRCGKVIPADKVMPGRTMCRDCYNADVRIINLGLWYKHVRELDDKFDEWITKVKQVPKKYPTLTEEQWLEACTHFNGCARCGNEDIDARGFFIGAELGGRYCDWNVIPLCEKCASNWDLTKSVFNYTERRNKLQKDVDLRVCLTNIIDYLGGKLDAARVYEETNKRT